MSTTITDIATVAIPVADQDRALAFYVEVLGFDKRLDTPIGGDVRWITVAPAGAHGSIALTKTRNDPITEPAGTDTGIRLTATDVDRAWRAMTEHDVDVDDVLRWPGVPAMFRFRDPDGNTLYVVEATP